MSKTAAVSSADWKSELNATAFKYHLLIARVGLVINLIFGIGDYFNTPAHFDDFMIFRVVISALTLVVVLFKDKFVNRPEIIVLVPFLGISIQNAYMYSVLSGDMFQKHTFAYITLYIAAGMFILWKPVYSIMVVGISVVTNILFFRLNSSMPLDEILVNGGLVTLTVACLSILLISSRTSLTKKAIIARLALAESNKELEIKNEIIEEKNKDIRDSINYALNIQRAILPPAERIDAVLKDYFILYKPKDIVSGDFYWFDIKLTTPRNNQPAQEVAAIAAIDCTGHGVPGALMSAIGGTLLNQTINRATANNAADALEMFNKKVSDTLNTIKDGMDMALCIINFNKMELQYSGANNPIYLVRGTVNTEVDHDGSQSTLELQKTSALRSANRELIEIKADKQAIGADTDAAKVFTNHIIKLEKGDCIYLFTDGYADQFGGAKGKKYKYGKFKEFLFGIHNKPMDQQKELLNQEFMSWKRELEQVDDVLVIGIRV